MLKIVSNICFDVKRPTNTPQEYNTVLEKVQTALIIHGLAKPFNQEWEVGVIASLDLWALFEAI